MAFSRFIWSILGFIAAIAATSLAFGLYLQKPGFGITVSVFAFLLVIETSFLIWYLVRIRRDLLRLVLALKHKDPTLQFRKDSNDPYFSAIHREFNQFIRDFRLVRLDREAEQQFFEATVNHIRFGIVAFDKNGNVKLTNKAFLDLFRIKEISRISALETVSPDLPEWMKNLSQESEILKKVSISGQPFHLIFLASRFILKGSNITLVSIRDISREIDRNELEAWQKLMRVLRHEILNSVTPIKLLSSNLSDMIHTDGEESSMRELSEQDISNMKTGLETIHRRATGLSHFMDTYSNLYRIPELELLQCTPGKLLQRIATQYREQCDNLGVRLSVSFKDDGITLKFDVRLIEQVVMNLVKNALEAISGTENPSLTLSAWHKKGEFILSVADNGAGIPTDQLDHIFIPFYSTREKGSGIGLSFAQHVMRLHGGRINVTSSPGKGSEFQLVFIIKDL